MSLPNFLIVGETKCGTTSMYDNLVKHPQVLPSKGNGSDQLVDSDVPLGVKEIRFFDKHYNRGWDWYKACFPKCPEGYITGEATPMYLYRTQALKHIADVIPDCKIIVMLRNPTDRLYSHFNHISANEADWIEKYPSVMDLFMEAHPKDYHLIDRGFYIRQLTALWALFDDENIHIMISEEMFENPKQEWSNLLGFLGLDYYDIEFSHSRKKKHDLTKNMYRTDIDRMYAPFNRALEDALGIKNLWR